MNLREAEYRALQSYMDIQDAEQWDLQRIEAGEPHPCEGCVESCRGCRFQSVKHTLRQMKEPTNLHEGFLGPQFYKKYFGV